jgi:hypothetical protein
MHERFFLDLGACAKERENFVDESLPWAKVIIRDGRMANALFAERIVIVLDKAVRQKVVVTQLILIEKANYALDTAFTQKGDVGVYITPGQSRLTVTGSLGAEHPTFVATGRPKSIFTAHSSVPCVNSPAAPCQATMYSRKSTSTPDRIASSATAKTHSASASST